MGGIRGHNPLEALPVFLLLVVVVFLSLRKQENGLLIGIVVVAGSVGLYVVARVVAEVNRRLRRYNLHRLRDLAAEPPSDAVLAEARSLRQRILKRPAGYRAELDGAVSFVAAARKDGEVAKHCRAVLFRLAPWSEQMERDIAAMRYQLADDEYAAWLEWFISVNVGREHFADRIADAVSYALPRVGGPDRKRLLLLAVNLASPRESWRRVGKVLEADLRALDATVLSSQQRANLELLLQPK